MTNATNPTPTDPTKPSYYLYQSDLLLKKISDGSANNKEVEQMGLKMQSFLNSKTAHSYSSQAYDVLKNQQFELARALSLKQSLNTCKGDRELNSRILKSALVQPVEKSLCSKNAGTTSFKQIQDSLAPISKKIDSGKSVGVTSPGKPNARPELLELRKQVYLESITNGIKNQLEIDFALQGYPRNAGTVNKLINNLIAKRCVVASYCTKEFKEEISRNSFQYAEKSNFTSGKNAVTDQGVVDQFCKNFNAYNEVKIYQNLKAQNRNEQKRKSPGDLLNAQLVAKKDGQIAYQHNLVREKQRNTVSVGYRRAALDMMKKGGVGLLFMGGKSGEEFQIPFNCTNLKDPKNLTELNVIRNNLKNGLDEHAKRLEQMSNPKTQTNDLVAKQLSELIKSNPGSFAQVIAKKPSLAISTCDVINAVQNEDLRQQRLDTALMIGGMVVAGALIATGVGAAFVAVGAEVAIGAATLSGTVAAMAGASGALGIAGAAVSATSMANNLNKYYEYDKEFEMQTLSTISSNGNKYGSGDNKTFDEAKKNQKKSDQALLDAGTDAIDVVMSPVGAAAVSEFEGAIKGQRTLAAVKAEQAVKTINEEVPIIVNAKIGSIPSSKFNIGSEVLVERSDMSKTIGKVINTEKDELGNKVFTVKFFEDGELKHKKVYEKSLNVSDRSKGVAVEDFLQNGLTKTDFTNKLQEGTAVFVKRTQGNYTRARIVHVENNITGQKIYTIEGTENAALYRKYVTADELNFQSNVNWIDLNEKALSAIDLSQIAGNSKLKKMAIALEDKMNVKTVHSQDANKALNSEGYYHNSTNVYDGNLEVQKKGQKIINVSEESYSSGVPGSTEVHEIGHAKKAINLENNIEDPMGVLFKPNNSTIRGYEKNISADESRQHSADFLINMRTQSEKEVLNLFNEKKRSVFSFINSGQKVSLENLFLPTIAKNKINNASTSFKYVKDFNNQNSKLTSDALTSLAQNRSLTMYSNAIEVHTVSGVVQIPLTPIAQKQIFKDGATDISKAKEYATRYLNNTKAMYTKQSKAIPEAEKYLNEIIKNPTKQITKDEYYKMRSAFSKVKTTVNVKPTGR